MKKKLLVLPFILSLSLVACNGSTTKNKKGDVINDGILKANTQEEVKNIYHSSDLVTASIAEETKSVSTENGFVIYKDTSDKMNVYSIISGKNILSDLDSLTYKTYSDEIAGGFIVITTSEGNTVYDALGNKLISETKKNITSITSGTKNSIDYVSITDESNTHFLFKYDSNGTPTLTASLDNQSEEEFIEGSSFIGSTSFSLDAYGHQGYRAIRNNGRIVIFDKNNNEVSSIAEPVADNEFMVGDYIIYQKSTILDDYNDNYDYLSSTGQRYVLESNKINYLTGDVESFDADYVLMSDEVKPLYDAKKVYSYAYGNLKQISEKKILSSTIETFILDESGSRHDNVTGIDLGKFVRFNTSYYNTDSKTIYDDKLNEISILSDASPVKVENANLIVCENNGLYGAINHQGRIVLPFIYERIYTNYASNNRIMVKSVQGLSIVEFDSLNCKQSIIKTFTDYSSIAYVGGESYMLSGAATTGRAYGDYITLSNPEPINPQLIETSTMLVNVSYARCINSAKVFAIETTSNAGETNIASYQAGSIVINH